MSRDAQASWQRELSAAARLSLVPIGVAFALGVLLLPRRGEPDSVPLPVPDARALSRVEASDRALAEQARREPLPAPVRALGSAVRDFHRLEIGGEVRLLGRARAAVDAALLGALPSGPDALLRLRAVQLERFVIEVKGFESTGVQSQELTDLAGTFVRTMQNEGWCEGHTIVAGEPVLRAMFKQMWISFLDLDARKEFALTLDERRVLYAFYLSYPTPMPAVRESIAAARRGAHDARACEQVDEAERAAVEARRIERISRLASFDPDYPAAYAAGVADLRRGRFGPAAEELRTWLRDHPDGPYTLRAESFLRTALAADRAD